MAMMISRVARVNSSHPYLENDPSSSLVYHRLRISPWLRFSNQLSGEIPPELGKLASLRWMNLGGNQLSGEIPPELGKLADLEGLDLGGNQSSGEIPPELGKLAALTDLILDGNRLSGCVPSSLSGQVDMEYVNLGSLRFCP